MTKWCAGCGTEKPLIDFYPSSKQYCCKECSKRKSQSWRERNREQHNATNRAWWARKSLLERTAYHRARKYGITLERFHEMLTEQEGCCAICHEIFPEDGSGICVDHVHGMDPVQVRALLCVACNAGIGNFHEIPELFDKAKLYVERWNEILGEAKL